MERSDRKVVMAKAIAKRWLVGLARDEHRVRVFCGSRDFRNLPNLLRSFRDGKVVLAGVPPIPDLGINTQADFLAVWSSSRQAMVNLNEWFEAQGLETTGIW